MMTSRHRWCSAQLTTVTVQGLTSEQTSMLEFAVRWCPYGGGEPGDILVEFGLTDQDYFTRLSTLLTTRSLATGLDQATLAALRATCQHRLASAYAPR